MKRNGYWRFAGWYDSEGQALHEWYVHGEGVDSSVPLHYLKNLYSDGVDLSGDVTFVIEKLQALQERHSNVYISIDYEDISFWEAIPSVAARRDHRWVNTDLPFQEGGYQDPGLSYAETVVKKQ